MKPAEKHQLQDAIHALSAGDSRAMPKLYELTSKVLYGKLVTLLTDSDLAVSALKATYLQAWRDRAEFKRFEGREIQLLAAIAHQCALEIRFRNDRNSQEIGLASPADHAAAPGRTIAASGAKDERDEALLRAAYLKFEDPEVLAQRFGMTAADVRSRLASLATGKGGQHDE